MRCAAYGVTLYHAGLTRRPSLQWVENVSADDRDRCARVAALCCAVLCRAVNRAVGAGRLTVTTRTNRHYIGSVTIPFSTIYANGRVKGEFRVDTPSSSLGYRHTQMSREGAAGRPASSTVVTASSLDAHGPSTYLFLSAAVDPPLPLPDAGDDEALPLKDRAFAVLGKRFEDAMAKRGRYAQVFGANMKA